MKAAVFLLLSCCLSSTLNGQPEATYYRNGETGVFAATVPVPPGLNLVTSTITARSDDAKVYLIYVRSPSSVAERLAYAMDRPRYKRGLLNDAERNRLELVEAKLKDANEERSKNWSALHQRRRELRGLRDLSTSLKEQKRENTAIGQETQASIKRLDAEVRELEVEGRRIAEKRKPFYEEQNRIWEEARKRWGQGIGPETLRVFGRFQGSGKAKVEVLARNSDELLSVPGTIATIDLDLPTADGGGPGLLTDWATAQAKELVVRSLDSPHSSYYQYCLLQSVARYGVQRADLPGFPRQPPRRRNVDLYAMTTGALAIQESLQLDEMTNRKTISTDRGVPIMELEGPTIKSHPFKEMLKGREPKMFPSASLVPFDNYYCHFTSISKEIAASDLMKQWGTSLLRAMTVTAKDSDLPSRYQEQLCIGVSMLTRMFGDLVIGEIAITGGDPFLKEGTDLTAIIEVRNRALFDRQMAEYVSAARAREPEIQSAESTHLGVRISSVTTPDRRISSHSTCLGNYSVYSNSLEALKLVIDTQQGKLKSMRDNLDFQYMRTIFKASPENEDGFLYFSDAAIRKWLSPQWKIEAQRRIVCQNHLRMIANAATMYRSELRRAPSLEELLEVSTPHDGQVETPPGSRKRGFLPASASVCPDGGSYSLDETGRARCSVHNCLRHCTPISSIPLTAVSKTESSDYARFVRRYSSYWSRFFDPIGIRLRLGERVELETCILPLIENSIYNQLREGAGGPPVKLTTRVLTDKTIASLSLKLNRDGEMIDKALGELGRNLPTLPSIPEAVGYGISANLYDSDVLFTFDERGMNVFGGWGNLEEQLALGLIMSSINLPIYVVVDLKDEGKARTILQEAFKILQRRSDAQARRSWDDWFGMDHYASTEHNGHTIDAVTLRLVMAKFRIFYAIASKRLILSTKRYVLEEILDSLDRAGEPGAEPEVTANLRLSIRPQAFDKLRPITAIGWQERMRTACLKNLVPIRSLIDHHGATEQTLGVSSRHVNGYTMRCPAGGAYRHDALRELVHCSVHGAPNHPRQPWAVTGEEPLLRFVNRLRDFSVDFRFTEEGIMTKLAFDLAPMAKVKSGGGE